VVSTESLAIMHALYVLGVVSDLLKSLKKHVLSSFCHSLSSLYRPTSCQELLQFFFWCPLPVAVSVTFLKIDCSLSCGSRVPFH
jgi:hypothetical protein